MALGDGIRRNIATVSKEERDRLRDAIIKLQTQKRYPGQRSDSPVGGVAVLQSLPWESGSQPWRIVWGEQAGFEPR